MLKIIPRRNQKHPQELVARAQPGELTYGTASPTGFQRLAGEKRRAAASYPFAGYFDIMML